MHKKKPEKRVENEVINKQKLSLELSEEKGPNGDSFVGILTAFPRGSNHIYMRQITFYQDYYAQVVVPSHLYHLFTQGEVDSQKIVLEI